MGISKAEKERRETARNEARDGLREWLGDGVKELYVSVQHVNSTGTSRVIAVYLPYIDTHNGQRPAIVNLGYRVAAAMGWRYSERYGGVVIGGGGMDMGFHLVSSVARALYGDDYAITHRWL